MKIIKKDFKNNKAHERYQSLCNEQKEKKRQYGHERYTNLPEDEKQKLVEYRKRYYKIKKRPYWNYKELLF